MPHLKNGVEAKPGQKVRGPVDYPKGIVEGYVVSVHPSEMCNMYVAFTTMYKPHNQESLGLVNGTVVKVGENSYVIAQTQSVCNCKDFELLQDVPE